MPDNAPEPTVTIMWAEIWTMSHTMTVAEAVDFANTHTSATFENATAHGVTQVLDTADLRNALAEFDISQITRATVTRHSVNVTSTTPVSERSEEVSPQDDPAQIARALTSAMREVMQEIDTAGFIAGHRSTLRALARRGLCGRPRYDFAEVTDLGRAVHAVLTSTDR